MMQVDLSSLGEDSEMVGAIVSAATFRVVRAENASGRRSTHAVSMSGGRVSVDDTVDMIKLIIVGDSGVGKSCLMLRFIKDEFVTSTRATVGMDFCTRQLNVDLLTASENSVVQRLTVQVWDTAGQEQFHVKAKQPEHHISSLNPMRIPALARSLRHVALTGALPFDSHRSVGRIFREQSLTAAYYRKAGGVMIVYDAQARATFDSLSRWIDQVDESTDGSIVKMIVAAKSEGDVAVSDAEGRAFAEQNSCLFATTSSMSGDGVLPAFKMLSSHVLAAEESRDEEREGIWLNAAANSRSQKKVGCC